MKHYITITRYQDEPYVPMEAIVIGPFDTADLAIDHMNNSADVEDWCMGEAKNKGYIVDDVYVCDETEVYIPSYGVNAPIAVS